MKLLIADYFDLKELKFHRVQTNNFIQNGLFRETEL